MAGQLYFFLSWFFDRSAFSLPPALWHDISSHLFIHFLVHSPCKQRLCSLPAPFGFLYDLCYSLQPVVLLFPVTFHFPCTVSLQSRSAHSLITPPFTSSSVPKRSFLFPPPLLCVAAESFFSSHPCWLSWRQTDSWLKSTRNLNDRIWIHSSRELSLQRWSLCERL